MELEWFGAISGTTEKAKYSRFLLPVLGLAVLSTWLVTVTFQLLLLDIANSFEVQVGTAGLTASVGAISGVVFGLLMAVLSVRFNHKNVHAYRTCLHMSCCVRVLLAPNFLLLLVPNIGVGAGIAMVTSRLTL